MEPGKYCEKLKQSWKEGNPAVCTHMGEPGRHRLSEMSQM